MEIEHSDTDRLLSWRDRLIDASSPEAAQQLVKDMLASIKASKGNTSASPRQLLGISKPYYRTVVEVEVLGTEQWTRESLYWLRNAIDTGAYSGAIKISEQTIHNADEMSELLVAQNSDPSFLGIGEDE